MRGATATLINEAFGLEGKRSLACDAAIALAAQSVYGRNLWALLGLELWHRQFVDGIR